MNTHQAPKPDQAAAPEAPTGEEEHKPTRSEWTERAEGLLEAIVPKTRVGRLSALWPTIDKQLAAGVTTKQIVEALNKAGLEISHEYFLKLRTRRHKKRGVTKVKPAQVKEATPTPEAQETEGNRSEHKETQDAAYKRVMNPETRYTNADKYIGRRRPIPVIKGKS